MSTWLTGQERHGAAEIDGEAALDAAVDGAVDALLGLERLFQVGPGFLAPRLFARQHDGAVAVLVALDIQLDGVAGLDFRLGAGRAEFLERDAAFGFQADIDDGVFVGEAEDAAGDDGAVEAGVLPRVSSSREAKSSPLKWSCTGRVRWCGRQWRDAMWWGCSVTVVPGLSGGCRWFARPIGGTRLARGGSRAGLRSSGRAREASVVAERYARIQRSQASQDVLATGHAAAVHTAAGHKIGLPRLTCPRLPQHRRCERCGRR